MGLRPTYRRCRFWHKKNHIFRSSSFWPWWVCKQSKLSYLGHREADTSETSHCLVRLFLLRHNWAIFHRKWASRGCYSQWRSLSGHVERIFVHKNWREIYWYHLVSTGRQYVPHSRSYIRCFVTCFWNRIISRRADVVWPPQSCDFGLLFVGYRQR